MKRRHWILLAVAVVATAGVIGGTVVAIGGGGTDSGGRPNAAGTVLRIEPLEDDVACGPGPVVVDIYLDDLAARSSPLDAEASYGVGSFEFPLRYDPAVLRLGEPADVVLNPGLDGEDADDDGVVRSFIPVMNIDDGAGFAALGAASFNPSSQGAPEANREEGLDPVAKGEPLLLMTVRFQTVGHGASALSMAPREERANPLEPTLLDPEGKAYEPVTVEGGTVTVRGGECPDVALATLRPTPEPPSTPYVPPTHAIPPTAAPVATVSAPDAGRSDCAADWNVYEDPDGYFSLCYPAGWEGRAGPPPRSNFGSTLSLDAGDGGFVTAYWREESYFEATGVADICSVITNWRDVREVTLSVGVHSAAACVGYETLHSPDIPAPRKTLLEIPLPRGDGNIVLFLTEFVTEEGMIIDDDTFSSVLASLTLAE